MAHKVTVEEKSVGVPLDTLREGEFGVVLEGAYEGHIVLRSGTTAVSLGNGTFVENLWSTKVRRLASGSKFTVEVTTLINLTYAQQEQVKRLLRNNEKINAIKYVREVTLVGLKEAKDYVDAV